MQRTRRIIAVLALTVALGACDMGDGPIDPGPVDPLPTDPMPTVPEVPDETTTTVAG